VGYSVKASLAMGHWPLGHVPARVL